MEIKKLYLSMKEAKADITHEDTPLCVFEAIAITDQGSINAFWYINLHDDLKISKVLMLETEEETEYYSIDDLADQGVEVIIDPFFLQFAADYYN